MALINALFPSPAHLGTSDDPDPSPYSPGHTRNIRFTLYKHLMSGKSLSEMAKGVMQMELLGSCETPDYQQSRHLLLRYIEESRKLEEICFLALETTERDSVSNISTSAASWPPPPSPPCQTDKPGMVPPGPKVRQVVISTPKMAPESGQGYLQYSSSQQSWTLRFGGVPGKELSPALTDLGAFIGDAADPQTPPGVREYPVAELDQHPLAKDLDMTLGEKAALGLLLPKTIPRRGS